MAVSRIVTPMVSVGHGNSSHSISSPKCGSRPSCVFRKENDFYGN